MTFAPGRGMSAVMLRKTGWNLRKEAELVPTHNECPTPNHQFLMNIIIWNNRGALKPNFQSHVWELAQNHDPTILVIMETRLGGDRAREITNCLPFDF